jgi:hypothetical protein
MKKTVTLISIITVAFVSIFIANTSYAATHSDKNGKILIVLTSHTELGNTGKKNRLLATRINSPLL